MKIQGLQKLTLLDYPEKVACTIFTPGCNFRCPFCHNAPLVCDARKEEQIPIEEVISFLKKRQGILDGVCITGGEPLLQEGLADFIRQVKELGFLVKLDTNGSFPDRLKFLVVEGLVDYVAMDIKNAPEHYCTTAGVQENLELMERVRESVAFLMTDVVPYEFRTTVVDEYHTEEAFLSIGQWIQGARRYYLQAFEDSGQLIGMGVKGASKAEMQAFQAVVEPFVPNVQLRGV